MKKLIALSILVLLVLLPAGSLLAQDDESPQVLCGNLAEEDCALLEQSRSAMAGLTSGTSLFTVDTELSNMPLLNVEDGTLRYSQATQFAITPEALEQIAAVQAMSEAELTAFIEDAEAYTEFVGGMVRSTDLAQTITLDLSDGIDDHLGEMLGLELPSTLSIEYVLVDGILYVDMTKLAELVPALGFLDGWVGIDLPSAMLLISDDDLLEPPEDAAEFQADTTPPGITYTGVGLLSEDEQSAIFDEHTTVVRLQDTDIDGVPVAVYASQFDLVGLLSDPDAQLWLIDLFGEELMASLGITKDNLGAMPAVLAIGGPMLFNELEYSIFQYVGTEDAYLYRNEVDFVWDLNRMATIFGAASSDSPIIFDVKSTTENSDLNSTVVEPPEGAMVLPLSLILQLIEGLQ